MKILYAIQGTGNGHVARAREVIPVLQSFGEVDVLLSGDQSQVKLPVQPKYHSKGLTFIYDSKGGISYTKTLLKNDPVRIYREIRQLPIQDYDVVINDFEFVSAWACKLKGKPCFGLSHQAALTSPWVPKPNKIDPIGKLIIHHYAPVTKAIGFHFFAYDRHIYTPVIRKEVRDLIPENHGHITVYLPAYSVREVEKVASLVQDRTFYLFSKEVNDPVKKGNLEVFPISSEGFLESVRTSEGVLTSAGFETPAEALFLGKKVAVIPIRGQLEQGYNAAAMAQMGIPVFDKFSPKVLPELKTWLKRSAPRPYAFRDQLFQILESEIFSEIRAQALAFTDR